MPTEREIEAAAKIIEQSIGVSYAHPDLAAGAIAKSALDAAERMREIERKENCKHRNKTGTGQISSDGSSKWSWYCYECGASGHSETPPQLARGALGGAQCI